MWLGSDACPLLLSETVLWYCSCSARQAFFVAGMIGGADGAHGNTPVSPHLGVVAFANMQGFGGLIQ